MIDLNAFDGKIFDKVVDQLNPITNAINNAKKELDKDPRLKEQHGEALKQAESLLNKARSEANNAKSDIDTLKNYK